MIWHVFKYDIMKLLDYTQEVAGDQIEEKEWHTYKSMLIVGLNAIRCRFIVGRNRRLRINSMLEMSR